MTPARPWVYVIGAFAGQPEKTMHRTTPTETRPLPPHHSGVHVTPAQPLQGRFWCGVCVSGYGRPGLRGDAGAGLCRDSEVLAWLHH